MLATSLPRRAGVSTVALAALTLAGSALMGTPASAAANGDVKIHQEGSDVDEQSNDPHVCHFYLDAFNFDPNEAITWTIVGQAPTPNAGTASGSVTADATGAAHTDPVALPDGHYKLTWRTADGDGNGKHKTFWVNCASPSPAGSPGPNGGPPAGGGGLARDAAISPVAGAAAVGLVAVGGAVWLRLRRRPHGA
ncbi:hypothetical protein ACYF6T_35505 [Streptomyces sp. 7R007]